MKRKREPDQDDLTGFLDKLSNRKWKESEEIVIFMWHQLLEREYNIYNIRNKHQCFREDNYRHFIKKPFDGVSNFYGCIVCGKYHFCYAKSDTCSVVSCDLANQKSCQYSGALITNPDNLEMTFHEDVCFSNEASFTYGVNRKNVENKNNVVEIHKIKYNINDNKKSQKKNMLNQKRILRMFEKSPKVANQRRKKLDTSQYKEIYEISIDSMEDEELEEGDEDDHDNIEDEEEILHEEDATTRSKREEKEDDFDNYFNFENDDDDDGSESDDHINEESDDDNGGCHDEGDNESTMQSFIEKVCIGNDDHGYTKNYHNNIQYKNDYFSFLDHIIYKEQKQKKKTESKKEYMIDIYKRDIEREKNGHPLRNDTKDDNPIDIVTTATESIDVPRSVLAVIDSQIKEEKYENKFKASLLSESVTTKINEETNLIVGTLIKVHCKRQTQGVPQEVMTMALRGLSTYYSRIIRNIIVLLYQSPAMDQLAKTRSKKNQNQSSKAYVSSVDINSIKNVQKNAHYHENTLCPRKICRSLLLHLFLVEFSLTDSSEYRIQIWGTDKWLTSFGNLVSDYYYKMLEISTCNANTAVASLSRKEKTEHCSRFKEGLHNTSSIINRCLAHYNSSPIWLRYMIFK